MKTCPYCNATLEDTVRFCHICGKEQPAQETPATYVQPPYYEQPQQQPYYEQPAYEQPAAYAQPQQPTYEQPAVYAQQNYYEQPPVYAQPPYAAPITPPPSKAKSIVGMILSIASVAMGGTGLLLTALFTLAGMADQDVEVMSVLGIVYGFMFLVIALPLAIIGFVMSSKAIAQGSTLTISRVGKILGIVGLILSGVLLILAIANIGLFAEFVSDPYYYYY